MSKSRRIMLLAAVLVFAAVSAVMLTSCNEQRDFNKVDVVTTTKPVTEPVTYVYSDLEVLGTRMGMSIEETQKVLGVPIEVNFNAFGVPFFAISRTGLDFVNEGVEVAVYFIFDADVRLSEIQYVSTAESGFDKETAIEKFDSLYGGHAESVKEGKINYIWFKEGDYIIITCADDGQNAISYFSKAYFELTQPEDTENYNKWRNGNGE